MITLIRGLLSLIVAFLCVAFAVANRQHVPLTWSPFHDPVTLPVFMIGLGGVFIGFIAGASLWWMRTLGCRLDLRRQKKRIASLEKDLDIAHEKADPLSPALLDKTRLRIGKA